MPSPLRLLIIGGTRFLGRHLAELALARGHTLTLLHRGLSGPGLFPQAEHLIADRNGDLAALKRRTWDAAIDTSGYFPRQVRHLAAHLAGQVGQLQFISTISVYSDEPRDGTDEHAPLKTLDDPTVETVNGDTYGALKALCEAVAREAFGARLLVARPGLIVGPHDPTGRFTWWALRLARGGKVLAPGDPTAAVQCIDARDAAAWLLHQAEAGRSGVFNLSGPASPQTLGGLLDAGRRTLAPDTQFTWVDEAFLLKRKVGPWMDMPLWLPRESAGLHHIDLSRARAAGLFTRPAEDTWADTLAWATGAGAVALPAGVGLSAEREADLLASWARRASARRTAAGRASSA